MSAATVEKVARPVRTFRTVTLDECEERGPVWLIQGLIEQSSVTAVTGEPGSAKSFLLIDLACHVAAGREWFGRKVERGAVLYIAAEAPESIKRRAALVRRVKFSNASLPVHIVCEPALLGDERQSALDREAVERLIDDVATEFGLPVVLVIIDTISASMGGGNENLDGMQRVVGAANLLAARTVVAVILNHHPNATGGSLRGHSSLKGTVSHGFQIEVKDDARIVNAFKQRDAESGRLFAYRLAVYQLQRPDNFGDPSMSCVIESTEIPSDDEAAEETEKTRLTLAARDALTASGGVVKFADILAACRPLLTDKTELAAARAVGRALAALREAGVVRQCKTPRGWKLT